MTARHTHRLVILVALTVLLATAASAQYVQFPRIGVSAAPDRYEPTIDVNDNGPFQMYIIALPPEDQATFGHQYGQFHWALLEACCGGAAALIDQEYNPLYTHAGGIYDGVTTSSEECIEGEVALLCTLTLQMIEDDPGQYFVMGGPMALSETCGGEGVVFTDLVATVNYLSDATPNEATSFSEVKSLFD